MAGILIIITTVLGFVVASDSQDDRYKIPAAEYFSDIPRHFEISGPNALATFNKYISNIENLAEQNYSNLTYKVEVLSTKRNKQPKVKKRNTYKKSKKFNVPLKKKNMKLSSFEMELRKYVSEGMNRKMNDATIATEYRSTLTQQTTTQRSSGKFKPLINNVKLRFSKRVRPVKSNLINLR